MGNRLTGKPTQTRNLLAENDMYHMFESTFLRQQVFNARELLVTGQETSHLAAFFALSRREPVAEKTLSGVFWHKSPKFLSTPKAQYRSARRPAPESSLFGLLA